MSKLVKIVAFSDPHGQYVNLTIPKSDILVCTGDFTRSGSWMETVHFLNWIGAQPAKYKILVPGNHDIDIEKSPPSFYQQWLPANTYMLINAGVNLCGLSFWGTPYTPEFFNWSFMLPRDRMNEIWDQVPPGLDFLLTHGPARGILDKNITGDSCGCALLSKTLREAYPRYHIFGHIHHSYGVKGTSINCSVLNDNYELTNKPIVLKIDAKKKKRKIK